MRVVDRAELPSHKCFVCLSNEDNEWVDTDQDFWPAGVTDRDGRIYLCGTCVEIAAGEMGLVRETQIEPALNAAEETITLLKTLAAEQEDQWAKVFELAPFRAIAHHPRKLPEVVTSEAGGGTDNREAPDDD